MLSPEEVAALRFYSGPGYRRINEWLRGEEEADAIVRAVVASIDSALAKSSLGRAQQLFRGIDGDAAATLRRLGVTTGSVISDSAFLSVSPVLMTARAFTAILPGGLILSLHAASDTTAVELAAFSDYPAEQEVLLPRGSRLRVIGQGDDGIVEVELLR